MRISRFIPFIMLLALCFSCKPQVPDEYLQPDEFEDVLYDYHLADAMADNGDNADNESYDVVLYRQAVLRKYGITQAEFDSSLVYYMRHADRLHKIYENLSKRFEDDAMALGASANDIRQFGDMKSVRDTSNLWRGVPSAMFLPKAPYNVMTFDITADSTYQKGDKLIFSFNCDFVYKEGGKNAIALLAVQFKNDSVASSTVRMSSNSNYSVTVSDGAMLGIKSIKGFIYLDNRTLRREPEGGNNLKLMFVNNIRLVRLRNKGNATNVQAPATSNQLRIDTSSNKVKSIPSEKVTPSEPKDVQPMKHRLMPATNVGKPLKMSKIQPASAGEESRKR